MKKVLLAAAFAALAMMALAPSVAAAAQPAPMAKEYSTATVKAVAPAAVEAAVVAPEQVAPMLASPMQASPMQVARGHKGKKHGKVAMGGPGEGEEDGTQPASMRRLLT